MAILGVSLLAGLIFERDSFLHALQAHRQTLGQWVHENFFLALLIYFLVYTVWAGLALPFAIVLSIIGGIVFGAGWAILAVSFASTTGATLAMFASRYLFHDLVQSRYSDRFASFRREMDTHGDFYLLALRLNPLIPFFMVNLLAGLTRISVWRFWIISQLGMLPATCINIYTAAQLGQLESASGLMNPTLLVALCLLSIFPLLARRLVRRMVPAPSQSKSTDSPWT
jgi:uncharacterized membrane protein YdjX (TVP38/TMEM64 family)